MNGIGRVCDTHGEWCPDGSCRWCEPVQASEPEGYVLPDGLFGIDQSAYSLWKSEPTKTDVAIDLVDAMNRLWAKMTWVEE